MFRLYSKGCEYAIRALIHIAPTNGTQRFQAKAICEKAGIPESFTRKVFQALVAGGFLEAVRGPGGGYQLTQQPETISVLAIIKQVDGENVFDNCIIGMPECNAETPCPLHDVWSAAKNDLLSKLEDTTLQDLIKTQIRRTELGLES